MNFKNKITRTAEVDPKTLRDHEYNWRVHPKDQREALEAVLDRVGWVQRVVVNENTMRIVDGHLRVAVARARKEPTVPVSFVDLSEEEERLALATFDTVGTFDVADKKVLKELLAEVGDTNEALTKLLHGISVEAGLVEGGLTSDPLTVSDPDRASQVRPMLPVFSVVDYDDSRCCLSKSAGLLYATTTRMKKCRVHPTQLYAPLGALDYEGITANKHVRVVVRAKNWAGAFESGEKVRLAGAEPIFWLEEIKDAPLTAVLVCDLDERSEEEFANRKTLLWGRDIPALMRAREVLGDNCYGVASSTPAEASETGNLILWAERVDANMSIPPMPMKIKNPTVEDLGFRVPRPMTIAMSINVGTFALCFVEPGKGIEIPNLTAVEVVR